MKVLTYRGRRHSGTVDVDYEYQAESWVGEVFEKDQGITSVEVRENGALRREWIRIEGKLTETENSK